MKRENFLKNYSRLSTVELLKILEEKENYQPVAIEVAQQVLSERKYSNDELNTAQAEINFWVNKKIERQKKINKKINNLRGFIDEHFGIRERSKKNIKSVLCGVISLRFI